MIIWALGVMLVMLMLSFTPLYSIYPAVSDDTHPNDADVFETCAVLGSSKFSKELAMADMMYLYVAFVIYIFSTIGSLFVFVHHRMVARDVQHVDKMRHFVLEAYGFPPHQGGENDEEHYKHFFEKAYPEAKIIGVSVVWDMTGSDLNMQRQVNAEIDIMERKRDNHIFATRTQACRDLLSERVEDGMPMNTQASEPLSSHMRNMPHINYGYSVDNAILKVMRDDVDAKVLDEHELPEELLKLHSTGLVYVVFQTRAQRQRAYQKGSTLQYGDSVIHLQRTWHDPETMLWENHTAKSGNGFSNPKILKLALCGIILFVAVTLWALLIYKPISSYLLSWESAPGMKEGHWLDSTAQSLLLSLPIVLSNQILYQACASLAEMIRFTTSGSRDLAYVAMYTIFVTYQTVFDISIVIQTAYGQHDVDSWKLAQASGVLGAKAIAQNPTIRDTLYIKMVGYLYPGTLLLPYLVEPLGMGVAQYFIFKWIIRSRADIGIHDAENMLLPLPFDLSRYGDILVSIMCCVLVCFIASPEVYKVFLYLLAMLLFCYIWDSYRVLRLAPRFFVDTHKLDVFCTVMLSIPCAMLAAAVVYRKYGAHKDPYMTRDSVPVWCFVAFFVHLVVHLVIFRYIAFRIDTRELHLEEDDDKHAPYEQVAKEVPYNWFNTNHVQCLRSKYVNRHRPIWCIPAKHGREYLLRKAPELGLFYETKEELGHFSLEDDYHYLKGVCKDKVDKVRQKGLDNVDKVRKVMHAPSSPSSSPT